MKTWAGTRASYGKQSRSGTRARHLSDFVQVEDLKNKNHVRSASMSASKFYTENSRNTNLICTLYICTFNFST